METSALETVSTLSNGDLAFELKAKLPDNCRSELISEINRSMYALGDKLNAIVRQHAPNQIERTNAWRQNAKQLFIDAGFGKVWLEEIENQYSGAGWEPWFLAHTAIGVIVLGPRKRVYHIEWTDTLITKHGEELFPNEDVTRSRNDDYDNRIRMIHAWGLDKAREYLTTIYTEGMKHV